VSDREHPHPPTHTTMRGYRLDRSESYSAASPSPELTPAYLRGNTVTRGWGTGPLVPIPAPSAATIPQLPRRALAPLDASALSRGVNRGPEVSQVRK
jgi:hypothetical protein